MVLQLYSSSFHNINMLMGQMSYKYSILLSLSPPFLFLASNFSLYVLYPGNTTQAITIRTI